MSPSLAFASAAVVVEGWRRHHLELATAEVMLGKSGSDECMYAQNGWCERRESPTTMTVSATTSNTAQSLGVGWRGCGACKAWPAAVHCHGYSGVYHTRVAHEWVWMCKVCELAPAAITCKVDAAVLCAACDANIHDANPLARHHARPHRAHRFSCCGSRGRDVR